MLDECLYKLQKYVVRRWLLDDGKRVDGRGMDEIRPLAAEVGIIAPRSRLRYVHPRSDTGADHCHPRHRFSEAQLLDGIDEEEHKALYAPLQLPVLLCRRDPSHAAAPAVVRSVTAHWLSALWCRSSRR